MVRKNGLGLQISHGMWKSISGVSWQGELNNANKHSCHLLNAKLSMCCAKPFACIILHKSYDTPCRNAITPFYQIEQAQGGKVLA